MTATSIFIPAWSYLLVHRDPVSEVVSPSGLIGAESALERVKPNTGEILAAGEGAPAAYAPGVRVAFSLYVGHKLTIAGDPDYVLLPSSEVMAWAVDWKGAMEDDDAFDHLLPPPGQLFAERLPDEGGNIILTDNSRTSTRSPIAIVHRKAADCGGPFEEGETVFLGPGVSRGFGLGYTGERSILTCAPQQILGWYRGSAAAKPELTPDAVDPIRSVRADAAIDDKFDEGDSRAPR